MATRADFYIKENDKYTLIGCTVNNYNGPFEVAKTASVFLKFVKSMLLEEGDTRDYIGTQKLGWPWSNSKLTDECFIFEIKKPKFWQILKPKDSGVLYKKFSSNKYSYGNYEDVSTPMYAFPINSTKWEDFDDDGEYIGKLTPKAFYLPSLKK